MAMRHRLFHSIAIVAYSTSCLFAQSEPKEWKADEVEQILKQRIDVDKQCVGIAVGISNAKGNQVIGSATKVFTTLLLADMVRRGEVALNDPASKYLPKTVTMPSRDGREITLLDLATHTSALPSLPDNFAPEDGLNPYADYTVERMYAKSRPRWNARLSRWIQKSWKAMSAHTN
jgi:hypothetical protein